MLNRGELEGRIDAGFYSPLNEKITYKFPTKQLRQISSSFTGGTPDKTNSEFWQGDIPWASPKDFKNFYLTETEDYISEKAVEKSSTKIVPANSVLVVVRSGVLIHTFPVSVNLREVAINQDLKALVTDSSVLGTYLGYYFFVFNKYILKQTVKHSTTVQSVNTFEFERLQIPIPPIETQQQIINQLDKAHAEKKAKEAEAREKLASVDKLVLDALGITLPDAEENTLARRIFFTKSGDIASGRFDAAVHQKKFSLQSSIFPMAKLKDAYAINPRTSFDHFKPETLLSFIPMEAISDGLGKIIRFYEREVKESKGYTAFQENDVLWAKITPCMQNGKSAVARNLLNGFGFGSTEYHVFRSLSRDANPSYLHSILRLKSLRQAAMNYFGGSAGHQRVDIDFFKTLRIPIPPPEIQKEIAERVETLYAEAKLLREQGAAILGHAKADVERMILGDG